MGRGKRKHTFLSNENMQTDENTKRQKNNIGKKEKEKMKMT
jgi:hypothetical protein